MSPPKTKDRIGNPPKEVQPTLFGIKKFQITQKATKRIGKNQFEVTGEFVRVEKGEGKIDVLPYQCNFCKVKFRTKNALGAPKFFCQRRKEQEDKVVGSIGKDNRSCAFVLGPSKKVHVRRSKEEKGGERRRKRAGSKSGREQSACDEVRAIVDKRRNNRGSAVRKCHSSRFKVEFVDNVNSYINEINDSDRTVASYFRDVMKCRESELQLLSNNHYKWGRRNDYEKNLRSILSMPKNSGGPKRLKKTTRKSSFHEMETELYSNFVSMRRAGRKVSARYLRTEGRRIFDG